MSNARHESSTAVERDRAYRGSLLPIEGKDLEFFSLAFGLHPDFIREDKLFVNGEDCYVFPIDSPEGKRVGYQERREMWTRYGECPRRGVEGGAQSKTWLNDGEKALGIVESWSTGGYNSLVLVEDYISALKVAQYGYDAACLFGCGFNQDTARALQGLQLDSITFALDPDAIHVALGHVRKWGAALPPTRVAILPADPKDCSEEALHKYLRWE